MEPYRVLVVDDSAFMRKIISDLIMQDNQFVIAATAANGVEAVTAAAELKPDVITMDLEMPMMNGIEALQLIMKSTPTPIIMLSGISEVNTRDTIKALQFGAFDFIRKPSSAVSDDIKKVGENLLEKLRIAVYARRSKESERTELPRCEAVPKLDITDQDQSPNPQAPKKSDIPISKSSITISKPYQPAAQFQPCFAEKKREKLAQQSPTSKSAAAQPPPAAGIRTGSSAGTAFKQLVAIGTSTGGPRALHEVISSLPGDFPAPLLIVQHMPPKFTKSLAQRLDSFSALTVVEAEHGMRVVAGYAYVAPGGFHMELAKDASGYMIQLSDQPQRNGHRPSVDVLFESLVPHTELERHAVIMTGMGSDGAYGMKALAEQGAASTIAESEETCVVYGMPRSAIECGAAASVLPLQRIAPKLVNAVQTQV